MSLRPRSRLERPLRLVIAALATTYVVAFFVVAAARLGYPYEVDNLESNILAMSLRILHGEPLYASPSIDYTAFCYPPLYFHVAAAVMRVIGPGYAALRLVSLVATLATSVTIYAVLRRDHVRPTLGLAAVAVFLGGYARTHYVGDAGRVDALALALALGALALMFSGGGLRTAVIAGCLGGLAVLAKQPMMVLIASAAMVQVFRGPWVRGLVFVAAAATTAVVVLAQIGLLRDPWLVFYCLDVPGAHHQRAWDLAVLGPVFLVTTLPVALGAPLLYRRTVLAWVADPWTIATLAYIPMALLARGKVGGSANVFLPIVALAAIQLGRVLERIRDRRPRSSLALLAGQLALLWWSPLAIWPTARDIARGDQVVAEIAAIPGDVYVPAFPAYAVMAGKPWHAHYVALCDLMPLGPAMRDELERQVAARRFAGALPAMDLDPAEGCDLPGLADHYHRTGTIDLPGAPSDAATVIGGPQLFDLVHSGKLGAVYR